MRRGAATLVLALLAGCGGGAGKARPAEQRVADSDRAERAALAAAPWVPAAAPGDQVVAEVDGVPIYASEVALQARARRITARAAVHELIARELLAAEARRRQIFDHQVSEARRQPLVRALLARVFAPSFDGPEDIPASEIDAAYRANQLKFVAPEARSVVYVRANVQPPDDLAASARGEALIRDLRQQFAASGVDCEAVERAGLALHQRDPAVEAVDYEGFQQGTDPTFGAVMFALPGPGALSQPTRTAWGWDVICLRSITPAKNTPRAQADAELRARFFDKARAAAFQRFVNGALRASRVEALPAREAIARAFGAAAVAEPTQAVQP